MTVPILPTFNACRKNPEHDVLIGGPPTRMQLAGRWIQWGSGLLVAAGSGSAAAGFKMQYTDGNGTNVNNGSHHNISSLGIPLDRWLEIVGEGAMLVGVIGFMLGTAMVEKGYAQAGDLYSSL